MVFFFLYIFCRIENWLVILLFFVYHIKGMQLPKAQEERVQQRQIEEQKIDPNVDNDKHQINVKKIGLKCSVLDLSLNEKQANSLKFSIIHLTQAITNQDWNCPSLLLHPLHQMSICPIKYFGFSEIDVTQTTSDIDINKSQQQKYNRQLLLGSKSKLKRQIIQENKQQKINESKRLFLYVEDGLTPISSGAIFLHQFDFQQRLDIVIDILQIFNLVHSLYFALFPHVLFPNEIQNSVLFTQNRLFKHQYQPHLKLSVHFLFFFKQNLGNSTKKFSLKEFVSSMLEFDNNQLTFKSLFQKNLRAPEIKFYNEEWYWKAWDKLFSEYVQSQTEKTYMSNLVTPTWIDLFQIPFGCLKFLYGDELIEKLSQKKYEEIKKSIQKLILNQKTKKSQNFQYQVIKLCQKPLIQWTEYQKSFKQYQQKAKKPQVNKNLLTTTKSSEKNFIETIISHRESRKVFEQLISFLGFFPINKLSKQKLQAKRCFSLSTLHQRLKKFKSIIKKPQKIVPVLIKSPNQQQSADTKSSEKKNDSSQQSLTLLESDDYQNQLAELKRKYLELLGSGNAPSGQQFEAKYVKKPETHLLTIQIKKKISTVFSSHNGIMKPPKSFTLVYKSSFFNFSTRKFYEFCENKSCLFYVMKIKNDRTLYYFNEEKINRVKQLNGLFGGFINDSKGTSFIYTGDEVLKVKNPAKSFGVSFLSGPIIGEGDIIIKQGNIENEYHYPRSYEAAKKSKKLLKSSRLDLEQMDVYQLQF